MSTPSLPAPRTPEPSEAPTLRWGISSTGGIAASMADTLRRHTRQEIVAVSSRSQASADRFAAAWEIPRAHEGLDAMLADDSIDIVYIASPHSQHHADAMAALRAGKHVLVEKAFTRDAAQARDVLDTARAANLIALEAMWTRFLPGSDVIRQLLEDGALGEVRTVLADHGQWFAPDPTHRLYAPELAGGALLDLGVYPLSFADFALPGVERELTATGDLTDTGVDRQVTMTLRSGAAYAALSTTLAARTPTTASISGILARVELEPDFYLPTRITLISRDGDRASYDGGRIRGHQAMAYEAAHLAHLVADGASESPLLPPSATLRVMTLLDRARADVGVVYPGEGDR
ncbi:Gfo/Idh/MocA family protein [Allobranchiibius sp. GilTou73]|uniref:Gfo/Idh/MocA family protein n=1 Tax=Allobranchiibius sp. GilTou73 TaxID=2904523 RepID=UPI001F2D269D|nr:Gfo/Idh/MocA family oxidoreductase [Allobranchiibius sp. GilTou73]UIJ34648.1 Gfo/Idh/MocA family oxidoreductase [Allobranchiibius sp. GilTou73]